MRLAGGHGPARRDVNLQPLDTNVRYVPWAQQKIPIVRAYNQFLRGSERRRICRGTSMNEGSTLSHATRMGKNGGTKAREGNLAVEVVLERASHALA